VAILPYAILRRVSSPSGSRTAPSLPLLQGGDRPALALVYTSGKACP